MEIIWYHCSDCEYKSKRKFDVKRHSNAKHLKNKIKEDKIIEDVENKLLDDILDDLIEELKNETILTETNDNETKKELHYCSKCNKSYKGTKYLVEHEKKCIGVNKLTCPKCMKMFTSYGNKFNHIKRNTCKARSVIHGINNTSNNTVININNITNNNNNSNNKPKTYKKQQISLALKKCVWNKYIGIENGKSKCLCCNIIDIYQISFHCGHVIAEIKGGETNVSNLRPICQNCNSSMGTMNMDDFMKKFL